jgi:hypothetical protein
MINKNLTISILVLTSLLAACTITKIDFHPEDEDYRVYSAVLRYETSEAISSYIFLDQTALTNVGIDDPHYLDYLQQHEPTITQAMYDDLIDRNQESVALEDKFGLTGQIVFLSEEEFQQFFTAEGGNGWDAFYGQYPHSTGLIYLSRPGYNITGDKAIVYYGNQAYYLAGAGYMVYLEKVDGEWQVVSQVMVWIS